jgi:hypothetical protein
MKVRELKWSLIELLAGLEPRSIKEVVLGYDELEKKLTTKEFKKLVHQKLKEDGWVKSIDLADVLGVTRQEVSQMLNRKKHECKYVKAIQLQEA